MFRRALLLIALAAWFGCDRNVEPYVPGEEPREPDLSRIFPEGAEEAARSDAPPELPPAPGQRGTAPDASAEAPPIRGEIRVDAALAERVPEGAVLYLMARRGQQGPPLAVQRIPSPRFPLSFELGPADRMIPTIPFAGPLQLSARLDGDGDAASRSAGDLQGAAPGSYEPGADGVEIVLDQLL
jgi:hypothetical protein